MTTPGASRHTTTMSTQLISLKKSGDKLWAKTNSTVKDTLWTTKCTTILWSWWAWFSQTMWNREHNQQNTFAKKLSVLMIKKTLTILWWIKIKYQRTTFLMICNKRTKDRLEGLSEDKASFLRKNKNNSALNGVSASEKRRIKLSQKNNKVP